MPSTLLQSKLLERIPNSYAIAKLMKLRATMHEQGIRFVDASVGESRIETPLFVRTALENAAAKAVFNRYPRPGGTLELRRVYAKYYSDRYGYHPDPERDMLPLLGSKSGIVTLIRCFADQEKPVYIGKVAYPAYRMAAQSVGAPVIEMNGGWSEGYVPDLDPAGKKGGIVFVSSPANPTGTVLKKAELKRLVEKCRENSMVLCYDMAYVDIKAESRVCMPMREFGSANIVELHTVSKSLALPGWRVGFAVGDSKCLEYVSRVLSVQDAGIPTPIEAALIEVFENAHGFVDQHVKQVWHRRQRLMDALRSSPLELFESHGGMFCWGRSDCSGDDLAATLLRHGVLVTPGSVFGEDGERCVRFSGCVTEDDVELIQEALKRAFS